VQHTQHTTHNTHTVHTQTHRQLTHPLSHVQLHPDHLCIGMMQEQTALPAGNDSRGGPAADHVGTDTERLETATPPHNFRSEPFPGIALIFNRSNCSSCHVCIGTKKVKKLYESCDHHVLLSMVQKIHLGDDDEVAGETTSQLADRLNHQDLHDCMRPELVANRWRQLAQDRQISPSSHPHS
jgi:hypothetical protein